ncbi:hypothetical protein B4113_3675 [Geobacillus sp. B4113_201601]|nr:hypothetical protein B4113_3675 [Geobacillus sp. B4113_201601]
MRSVVPSTFSGFYRTYEGLKLLSLGWFFCVATPFLSYL